MLLSATAKNLEEVGVQTVGVMATGPKQARFFFRFRPAVQVAAVNELRDAGQPEVPVVDAYETLGRLDGYTPTEGDMADFERHRAQLTAQFLVDPDGVVRWVNIECARDGLDGVDQMPSDEHLLAAVRAL